MLICRPKYFILYFQFILWLTGVITLFWFYNTENCSDLKSSFPLSKDTIKNKIQQKKINIMYN